MQPRLCDLVSPTHLEPEYMGFWTYVAAFIAGVDPAAYSGFDLMTLMSSGSKYWM